MFFSKYKKLKMADKNNVIAKRSVERNILDKVGLHAIIKYAVLGNLNSTTALIIVRTIKR